MRPALAVTAWPVQQSSPVSVPDPVNRLHGRSPRRRSRSVYPRNKRYLESLADGLRETDGDAVAVPCDLGDPDAVLCDLGDPEDIAQSCWHLVEQDPSA
mgnify:CR=1 FL=1